MGTNHRKGEGRAGCAREVSSWADSYMRGRDKQVKSGVKVPFGN